jgi:hypothetical protein
VRGAQERGKEWAERAPVGGVKILCAASAGDLHNAAHDRLAPDGRVGAPSIISMRPQLIIHAHHAMGVEARGHRAGDDFTDARRGVEGHNAHHIARL